VRFFVIESFRGGSAESVDVLTAPGGCGFSVQIGRSYFVYAHRSSESADLMTSVCSGTRAIDEAAADLLYARAFKEGRAPLGHIGGQVLLAYRDLAGLAVRSRVPEPMAGIAVRVTKDGMTSETATDPAGEFAVESRGAGRYLIDVELPDGCYSEGASTEIDLPELASCRDIRATAYHDGRVTGRVTDFTGRPIAGLTLELGVKNGREDRGRDLVRTVSAVDGSYEFARIPPGRFLLGVSAERDRQGTEKHARIFHPGVERIADATSVIVGSGNRVRLPDLRLPRHVQYVQVSGFVVDPDGAPASGVRVYLKGRADDDYIVSEGVKTDGSGRFTIAALGGRDYRLFAERLRPGDRAHRIDSTDPLLLSAIEGLKPVRLTLQRRY
jgi:Carboxypeptidase regulatory-like domain